MFGRGMGIAAPENSNVNATKYKYVILLLEITHDSKKRKITKTGKTYNIYVIRQQQYNSFTKKKTYFDGHLEVYDVFPAKLVTWDDFGAR